MQDATTFDVIIVGAGLSGAVCFDCLSSSSAGKTLLLEARDRLGGRSCSDIDGAVVDTGGQWLGSCHRKVLSLCSEFGLEIELQDFPTPSGLSTSLIEMAYYPLKPLDPSATEEVAAFQEYLVDSYRRLVNNDMVSTATWDRASTLEVIKSRCHTQEAIQELSFFVQTVLAVDAENCSFLFFLHYVFQFGGGERGMELLGDGPEGLQALKVKGGMQQVTERLCYRALSRNKNCCLTLGCVVRAVGYDEEDAVVTVSATVTSSNAESTTAIYRCRRLVLALSPTLYSKLDFSPPTLISPERRGLLGCLSMAACAKVICVFTHSFWEHQLPQDVHGASSTSHRLSIAEVGLVSNIFTSQVGGRPALICLITGRYARLYSSLSEAERRGEVVNQLRLMYPKFEEPSMIIEKDWTQEPFSGGCFAAIVGPSEDAVYAAHGALLRDDIVENRIMLAGTEASTSFYGYLEGAALRGQHVAESILQMHK